MVLPDNQRLVTQEDLGEIRALRDQISAGLDVTDGSMATIIDDPESATGAALSSKMDAVVASQVPGLVADEIAANPDVVNAAAERALTTEGVVTGAADVGVDDDRAYGHVAEPVGGVGKMLPLGYTATGRLDSFARRSWLADVHDTSEISNHPEFQELVITDDDHILFARRWDGTTLIPGIGGATRTAAANSDLPASWPSTSSGFALSPFDSYLRNGEVLPVIPDTLHIAGVGSSTMNDFSSRLSAMSTSVGATYHNLATGGLLAVHQAARTGAILAQLDAFTLPADTTPVEVDLLNLPTTHAAWTFAATILGRAVTFSTEAGHGSPWVVTPSGAGASVDVPSGTPLFPDGALYRSAVWIVNTTKNDLTGNVAFAATLDVAIEQADTIIDFISPLVRRVLVLGHFIDRDTPEVSEVRDKINTLNAHQQARYGPSWIDVGAYLTGSQVWTDTGITPTSEDLAQQALGNKPPSLSTDALHMNAAALTAVQDNLITPFFTTQTGWYTA